MSSDFIKISALYHLLTYLLIFALCRVQNEFAGSKAVARIADSYSRLRWNHNGNG